jgi:hypothetical protein
MTDEDTPLYLPQVINFRAARKCLAHGRQSNNSRPLHPLWGSDIALTRRAEAGTRGMLAERLHIARIEPKVRPVPQLGDMVDLSGNRHAVVALAVFAKRIALQIGLPELLPITTISS